MERKQFSDHINNERKLRQKAKERLYDNNNNIIDRIYFNDEMKIG